MIIHKTTHFEYCNDALITIIFPRLSTMTMCCSPVDHQCWLDSFSFESDITDIFKWFCLSEFAVLKPKSIGSEVSRNESALNFVLSSVSVALNNTGSLVKYTPLIHTPYTHPLYSPLILSPYTLPLWDPPPMGPDPYFVQQSLFS